MKRGLALGLLVMAVQSPWAAATMLEVCYNWGCATQARVGLDEGRLAAVAARLRSATDPEAERAMLGEVVGGLYRLAGEAAPIRADQAGNWRDQGVEGRMDCIDHATSTTRLLRILERGGWLRFHRVLEPALRTRFIIGQHYSAVIEEMPASAEVADAGVPAEPAASRYAVDSWFVDHGEPAVILPLADWLNGDGPNVH